MGHELHTTLIRNEHAYYSSISQMMLSMHFPIAFDDKTADVIYVCGDSHCLSSAWRLIRVPVSRCCIVVLLPSCCRVVMVWTAGQVAALPAGSPAGHGPEMLAPQVDNLPR